MLPLLAIFSKAIAGGIVHRSRLSFGDIGATENLFVAALFAGEIVFFSNV